MIEEGTDECCCQQRQTYMSHETTSSHKGRKVPLRVLLGLFDPSLLE